MNSLISDLLATGKSKNLKSPAGIARALGEPLDPDRTRLFESLYEALEGEVFPEHKDKNTTDKAYKTFAFFEGYFSNYIEGTEFTVNEAKELSRMKHLFHHAMKTHMTFWGPIVLYLIKKRCRFVQQARINFLIS